MGTGDEILSEAILRRVEGDVSSALKRRPPNEARLAGALRALAPRSPAARNLLAKAGMALARRAAFDRDLFAAAVRDLAEAQDPRALPLLRMALAHEGGGGPAVLSAACFTRDESLAEPLVKLLTNQKTHLAFLAELARVVRGESNGVLLAGLAPKLKESYRIDACIEAFLPLARAGSELPSALVLATTVLRDAERHLGRWLVLSEVAMRAGDPKPLLEARAKAIDAPVSARAAWALAAWALSPEDRSPADRPTMGLIARLSDRPSADRDTTFLFRMAEAGLRTAEPMLEALAQGPKLEDDIAVRAALYLARDHGRDDLRKSLVELAESGREELRGLAAAALWDVGEADAAARAAGSLAESRLLGSLAWSALVSAAGAGKIEGQALSEPTFRRLQRGWLES